MRYTILNRGDELSMQLSEQLRGLAASYGLIEDPASPEVVVSVGGDGTMLHAFHTFREQVDRISFVGVHTGHLGFFADWKKSEIEALAKMMADNRDKLSERIVRYPIVKVQLETDAGMETHYALNEFTLKGDKTMLVAQLNINDEPFEMFRGDGICVSTPSGSTAYNKSLGGAVIHPSLETIQIAEIASINNRVYRTLGSSIILPRHHHCDLYPKTNSDQPFVLTIDHLQYERSCLKSVRCMVADQKASFARFRPFPFWTRVREAFVGDKFDD